MTLLSHHGLIKKRRLTPSVIFTSVFAAGSGTYVFTPPTTPTEGNLMVIFFGGSQTRAVTGVPSGWSEISISFSGSAAGTHRAYMKRATASEPADYTFTFGASLSGGGRYFEIANVDEQSPVIFAVGVGSAPVTTISPDSSFTVPYPAVALTGISLVTAGTWAADNGYITMATATTFWLGRKPYPSVGAGETVNWTGDSSEVRASIILFKGRLI